jgi:hypothetical protein
MRKTKSVPNWKSYKFRWIGKMGIVLVEKWMRKFLEKGKFIS